MTHNSEDPFTKIHEFDLPPRWDGDQVVWRGWLDSPPVYMCPEPHARATCSGCGSIERPVMNTGTVTVDPPTSASRVRKARLERPVVRYRLSAFRCTRCSLDTIRDWNTDQWWSLDPTDYGREGSTDKSGEPS